VVSIRSGSTRNGASALNGQTGKQGQAMSRSWTITDEGFNTEPQFWLNLQSQYDLAIADRQTGDAIRHLPTRSGQPPHVQQSRLV